MTPKWLPNGVQNPPWGANCGLLHSGTFLGIFVHVFLADLAQKGVHFGTPFFSKSGPWVHFGGSVSQKEGPRGGSEEGPKKESQMVPNLASI